MEFGIVGGDSRFAELARLLERDGHTVSSCRIAGLAGMVSEKPDALETALSAETVILPLPLCREPGTLNCAGKALALSDVLDLLERHSGDGQLTLAGLIPEDTAKEAERRGIRLSDYFRLESLAVDNASATADAALCLTLRHTRETLAGKRCLVLGFGRIGKLLCLRLRSAGAIVTAAARKSADRAWIRAFGCKVLDLHTMHGRLDGFDLVYNTVPAPVLDSASLEELAGKAGPSPSVGLAGNGGLSPSDESAGKAGPSPSVGLAGNGGLSPSVESAGNGGLSPSVGLAGNGGLSPSDESAGNGGLSFAGAQSLAGGLAGDGISPGTRPLLAELASRPGFDRMEAERLGLRILDARSLPGRIVPVTAAAALRDAVYEILTEESASRGKTAVFDSEHVRNAI